MKHILAMDTAMIQNIEGRVSSIASRTRLDALLRTA